MEEQRPPKSGRRGRGAPVPCTAPCRRAAQRGGGCRIRRLRSAPGKQISKRLL